MCEPVTLHENNFGHIMKCHSCNLIQISLGNIVTNVNDEGYEDLRKVFIKIADDRQETGFDCSESMRVMIKTPVEQFWMAFTKQEFEDALELFEMSSLMMQINNSLISN
jgi:hypothetical protein